VDIEAAQIIVTASRHRHITALRADVSALNKTIACLNSELQEFMKLGDISMVDDRGTAAIGFENRLAECAFDSFLRDDRTWLFFSHQLLLFMPSLCTLAYLTNHSLLVPCMRLCMPCAMHAQITCTSSLSDTMACATMNRARLQGTGTLVNASHYSFLNFLQ
jgi:hypothetical protein